MIFKLAEEIKLDTELVEKLRLVCEQNRKHIDSVWERTAGRDFSLLGEENDMVRLAVMLKAAVKAKERYRELGISMDIYKATMEDIRIWCENDQNRGLYNYGWIANHVKCELFRLGRLQFQFGVYHGHDCVPETALLKKGDTVINVHIPQGEKLVYDSCTEAVKEAGVFFAEYFPEYRYEYYLCESWLLSEHNREFMVKDCNILKFASMFTIISGSDDGRQTIERVFGDEKSDPAEYPEETSLQKSAKYHLLSGGSFGEGEGVIGRTRLN